MAQPWELVVIILIRKCQRPAPEPEPQVEEMTVKVPSVKTGDESGLTLLVVLLILSCAAVFICVKIPSKTK